MARRRLPPPPPETETDPRDDAMARLLAARVSMQAAIEAIDEAGVLFVNPDEDPKGKERREAIGEALEATGSASRALEAVEACFEHDMTPDDWKAHEPWEETDDPDDEDDEDDDEEID